MQGRGLGIGQVKSLRGGGWPTEIGRRADTVQEATGLPLQVGGKGTGGGRVSARWQAVQKHFGIRSGNRKESVKNANISIQNPNDL